MEQHEIDRIGAESARPVSWAGDPHPLRSGSRYGPGYWRAVEHADGGRGRQVSRDRMTWCDVPVEGAR